MLVRSPRTWGWTGQRLAGEDPYQAFPTHVGMDRVRWYRRIEGFRVPHARGDGPTLRWSCRPPRRRSPRTWGWTDYDLHFWLTRVAFPTHVGMDRVRWISDPRRGRVPHARGDGPEAVQNCPFWKKRSPRTWGWTASAGDDAAGVEAFPTHVGMDRCGAGRAGGGNRVPHARGDGPSTSPQGGRLAQRSPRTWGWTGLIVAPAGSDSAFPTHVGMDRHLASRAGPWPCVPHARGDGP